MSQFAIRLIDWQRLHGRNALPWQGADAYHVWLSEIMLQQTQVATVIPYYQRFVARFSNVATLAAASEEEVLEHWSGLGYYARGRNLHRAAQQIMQQHAGKFPESFDNIVALPGVGRSTAAAICALAFRQRHAILDGNVKRVLARYCAIDGYAGDKKVEAKLWQQAEVLLPEHDVACYTQGLMDLGALICTRNNPKCTACPVQSDCAAYQNDRVQQLPAPRPRKPLPERYSAFLLLLNGSDILLEKRPPGGIWGGLWCMPQIEEAQDIASYFTQRFGVDAGPLHKLSPLIHTFTHFRLHITPMLAQLDHQPLRVQEPGSMWMDVDDALRAAIPAPVRTLLQQVQAQRIPVLD